jgi:hypothetical protein
MVDIMAGPGTGVTATTDAAMWVVATDADTFGVATVALTPVVGPIMVAWFAVAVGSTVARSAAAVGSTVAQSTAAVASTAAVDTVADTANGKV